MSRETDIAWAAGLFEGEGWFTVSRGRRRRNVHPVAGLTMTDRDVVEKFHSIVGMGNVRGPYANGVGNKQVWRWDLATVDGFKSFVELILPHLGERRRSQAMRVLEERAQYDQRCDARSISQLEVARVRAGGKPVPRPTGGAALP